MVYARRVATQRPAQRSRDVTWDVSAAAAIHLGRDSWPVGCQRPASRWPVSILTLLLHPFDSNQFVYPRPSAPDAAAEKTHEIRFVSVKFLEVIKPFCSILPEIAKPERKVSRLLLFGEVPAPMTWECSRYVLTLKPHRERATEP